MIPENLGEKIKAIPEKPGVYKMKDRGGNILYIGKSKSLRSRVKSYFYADHGQEKIKEMVSRIGDIDIIITDTHLEAQLLECELIKRLQPPYNRQFKNDRSYVYLRVGDDSRTKPLSVMDERTDEYCIGPYRSKGRLIRAAEALQNLFPITKCGKEYGFQYSVLPRPMNDGDFESNRQCLLEILLKKECMEVFLSVIAKKMEEASLELKYELASVYRDMLGHVKYIGKGRPGDGGGFEDREVLMGERIEGGYKVFYISDNRIVLKKKYRRLTRRGVEAFLKKARGLRDSKESDTDEKRQLDFKRVICAELRDTKTKAVSLADGQLDIDLFINGLRPEKGTGDGSLSLFVSNP
ncbi:MAG: GIY-YIG nuclease family protein [Clostridia bacterium]|jgi:excinuclease ABC subunit C